MPGVNGLPSVTEILRDLQLTHAYTGVPDEYRKRGTALHLAIKLHAEGRLDVASLHPEIRGGFDAHLAFANETGHVPLYSEIEITHPWGFLGHLDRVGRIGLGVEIVDWKFTKSPDVAGARLQLAGYRLLWEALHPEVSVKRCLVVALGKDGRYKIHDVTDDHAVQVFTSAVIVYKEKHR